jgi:hypothetical protein
MAFKTKTTRPDTGAPKVRAVGDYADTGAPGKTPSPLKPYDVRDKDLTYGRTNYGSNGQAFRSSTNPGEKVQSPLAQSFVDPVLAQVQSQGAARSFDTGTDADFQTAKSDAVQRQTRVISEKNVPDHPAQAQNRARQPSPATAERIPGATQHTVAAPVRQPR